MISRLTGILASKRAPQILIDCNGVGYEADVSMTTYYQLPDVGERVSIWTHLLVKVGFTGEDERKLFRQLIRINGVGPKMALTILSGIDGPQFALCISNNDVAMLTWAGSGVAVANAIDEAAGAADLMIGHHDDDAVAVHIESILGRRT